MKLLLVDDQPLFLEGLRHLLSRRGIEVIGTARDGFEALAAARLLHPEVILMDLVMPRCNGIEATRLIKAELPDVKVVMLSVSAEDDDLFEAIRAGASGYLVKSLDIEELLTRLSGLSQGEPPLSPGLAAKILEEFARQGSPAAVMAGDANGLNSRQVEVLTLLCQGLTYRHIGAALCIGERTVKYHVEQVLGRLQVQNRAQAIAYAQRVGLVTGKYYSPDPRPMLHA